MQDNQAVIVLHCDRVVRQGAGERNFHVFYYLFAGASDEDRKRFKLQDITSYHYLRGGYRGITRDGVIDVGK